MFMMKCCLLRDYRQERENFRNNPMISAFFNMVMECWANNLDFTCKNKSQNFVEKLQNFDGQEEPLRFTIKFFNPCVCNLAEINLT